jgi:type III restriction enzyme
MELKKYQQKTLDRISEFLKDLNNEKPEFAFMHITKQPYKDEFFGNIPFVCIKIPTGGGKTLVGCHATTLITDSFLKDKMSTGIVMWFVPSEAIKSQTLRKFKDRKDIHRKILDEYFDNNVKIFANEEALKIRKEDVENNLCIIISSLDAFRKEKTLQNKYKVYKENGALINHFENIEESKILEKDESGIINSLANVIRMDNPLIIIDEGHKTKTALSITFLKELNPSFVIEYTATPRPESNVLVEIHSSELKEEQMVKLPLILESHTQWQDAMLQGILRREELEKIAKKDKEPIRPIALLQAEQVKEDERKITVSKIKDFLIKERNIPEDEIAIKTSENNELEGIDLFAKSCKIRYIITVNALAEGWDCSFAYVLISVANIGSKVAVEQIIGRIMRMPYAKRRETEDLNRSYVFASARNFNEAANEIISGLESHGYSKFDLINANEKNKKYEFDIERRVKEDFTIPLIATGNEELTFEELIGEDFELHKQDSNFELKAHNDYDRKAEIDIKENDMLWVLRETQQTLKKTYGDKACSKKELIQWLDKRLKYTMLDKDDKVKFLEKLIDNIKGYTISDLSVNRYVLLAQIDELIYSILIECSKKKFYKLLKDGKLKLVNSEKFPEVITLSEELPQEFNKNYYTKIDKLNKEELRFVERLDLEALPNIKFWIRNRERKDPFYLQGWQKNRFYPDFIAVTDKGNILALEWKGEDRKSNDDTKYKEEVAKIWERLGKGTLHFFLAHNENIEETLIKIKKL